MQIGIVGGIYGKNLEYRSQTKWTPETILESGFRERGHSVITLGHRDSLNLNDLDIVHVHHLGYAAIRVAASNGAVPFVFTSHEGLAMSGMVGLPSRLVAAFVMSRADAVIALSQTEESFQRRTYPLAGAIQRTIRNGVNTESYKFKRENCAGKQRPWQLLYVGQLIEQKGVDRLLVALARLQQNVDLQLVFHVDLLRDKLEQLVGQLGLQGRVSFLGAKSPDELNALYQRSDLLVLPSFGEALPSVITEAMLCGTPVVATDVGGIRDQLGGFGVIVPPGETDELAKAIIHVLDHYDRFAQNSEAMSRYARQRFSIETMVESHLELYRSLIEQKEPRRRNRVLGRPLNAVAQLAVNVLCKT